MPLFLFDPDAAPDSLKEIEKALGHVAEGPWAEAAAALAASAAARRRAGMLCVLRRSHKLAIAVGRGRGRAELRVKLFSA